MIIYRALNIQDNGVLFVHLQVDTANYYEDIVLTGARIDTPLTYGTDTPYDIITGSPSKHLLGSAVLPPLDQQFFIVTPIIQGTPGADVPCGGDVIDIGMTYNKKYMQEKGLSYLKELGDSCTIPKGFIDYILKTKALDLSIETCNYFEAVKYWKMLVKSPVKTISNNCGCHGLN